MVEIEIGGIDYDLNPREIPVIGPWIGKVGRVIDILGTPCEPDPYVMAYAMFYGLPKLAIAVLKPDELDYVTERWGAGHRRKKKRRFHVIDLIDPDWIPKKNTPGWAWFRLGSWAERAGWYLIVIDATIDFAVYWTSTVYAFSGCEAPGVAFARSVINTPFLFPFAEGRHLVAQWEQQDHHIFAGDSNSIDTPAGYQCSVGASMICQRIPDFPTPYAPANSIEIVDNVTGQVLVTDTIVGDENSQSGAAISKLWRFTNPTYSFSVYITKEFGTCNPIGSRFWCYGSKQVGLAPDP